MEVHLNADQEAFIREGIESGRLHRAEDAVEEAMSLWEDRERRRLEILSAIDSSESSMARGEGRTMTSHDHVVRLAEEVKQRGRKSLEAENRLR